MTFWDFLQLHGPKLLGLAQGSVVVLSGVVGLIPPEHLKYWMAASALLTFWSGTFNSQEKGK